MRRLPRAPQRRAMVAFATLAISLIVLSGCRTEVQHGLSEPQANEILVLLEDNGISGSKSREGRGESWIISVPTGDASRSWQIMQAYGLPRRPVEGFDESFDEGGLIPTPTEDRVRIQRAIAGELERSLMAMDGVVDARVHLVVPAENSFRPRDERPEPTRASVLLIYQVDSSPSEPLDGSRPIGNLVPTPAQISRRGDSSGQTTNRPNGSHHFSTPMNTDAVQRLVAGAVERLQPENVVVVTSPRRVQVPPTGQRLASFGPLTVSASSKRPLQILVLVLVLLNVALGVGLGLAVVRFRRQRTVRS